MCELKWNWTVVFTNFLNLSSLITCTLLILGYKVNHTAYQRMLSLVPAPHTRISQLISSTFCVFTLYQSHTEQISLTQDSTYTKTYPPTQEEGWMTVSVQRRLYRRRRFTLKELCSTCISPYAANGVCFVTEHKRDTNISIEGDAKVAVVHTTIL
jgi:hypothetical protein